MTVADDNIHGVSPIDLSVRCVDAELGSAKAIDKNASGDSKGRLKGGTEGRGSDGASSITQIRFHCTEQNEDR